MIAPSSPITRGSPFSAARNERSATANARKPVSWLAAQGRLPLAFMILGLAWLGAATVMLVGGPDVLTLSHAAPAVVTLTHAWMLGVFVTVATGAAYQIAPVALGTTLWSERYGWWHFGLHAASVPGMVFAFSRWDMPLLGHFGTAFALGIGLFATNTWKTVRRSGQRDAVAWSLILSAGWLLLTVLAGLVFAANRFWHFIALDPIALLRAHAHLGLVGFFVTLLQGVTFRLVPMFTLADVPDWKPVRGGLWLSQIGLIGLLPALAWHSAYVSVFAVLVLAGMIASGRALQQTLRTRKKRFLDRGLRAFVGGMGALVAAAVLGCLLSLAHWPGGSQPGGPGAMVYALLVVAGGLLPIFTGMMSKIIPFLTWMIAYGPKVGRMPTPSASALSHPHLETGAFILQAAGVPLLMAGAWTLNAGLLAFGTTLLGLGVGLFLLDMAFVLRHLRSTTATVQFSPANAIR